MSNVLSGVVITACLLVALWTVVLAVRDRPVGDRTLAAMGVVELLLAAQAVYAVVAVVGGKQPPSTVTFLAYGFGALLIPLAGTFWSLAERSRSGTLVLTVACLALPVMTVRMLQMWSHAHG